MTCLSTLENGWIIMNLNIRRRSQRKWLIWAAFVVYCFICVFDWLTHKQMFVVFEVKFRWCVTFSLLLCLHSWLDLTLVLIIVLHRFMLSVNFSLVFFNVFMWLHIHRFYVCHFLLLKLLKRCKSFRLPFLN